MIKLSVNINKVALLRNARNGERPNLLHFAKQAIEHGADGITVHPRPDERHIRYSDVYALKEAFFPHKTVEFNIEGYPSEAFLNMVEEVQPDQCTLVPDKPDQLTSDHGWDPFTEEEILATSIARLQKAGVRVSLFADPNEKGIEKMASLGAHRIELYTGPYAEADKNQRERALQPYIDAANTAESLGLGVNAGHDLNLDNLALLAERVKPLHEVSIGQALIADCLYYGLENVIGLYARRLGRIGR